MAENLTPWCYFEPAYDIEGQPGGGEFYEHNYEPSPYLTNGLPVPRCTVCNEPMYIPLPGSRRI